MISEKNKGNLSQIVFSNIIFFILFILFGEIFFRTIKLAYKCAKNECDGKIFTLKPYQDSINLGIAKHDKLLGHVPKDNLSIIINQKGWDGITVNTYLYGLRESNINSKNKKLILNVGDSFAFGAQVSDKDTYQYCLNSFTVRKFINGGVNGYGTAQSILRAQKLYPLIKPSGLLVQTLVGRDFSRDRLSIKSGFVKPYFSQFENGTIKVVPPPSIDTPNTKFTQNSEIYLFDKLIVNITFLSKMPREFPIIGNITNSLRQIYKESLLRITSSIYEEGENPAKISDIIDWSVEESKKLDPDVVWLLTYADNPTKVVFDERELIIKKLNNANIKYIDTFDYLFGKKNTGYSKDDLWIGHHTPLGNYVVCKSIRESEIYEE